MGDKMTPEGKRLNVAAMAWWRSRGCPSSDLFSDPAVASLVKACEELWAVQRHNFAVKQTRDSFALERGPQGEQLDGDTSAGSVEQEAGTVGADRPDASAVRPVAGQ